MFFCLSLGMRDITRDKSGCKGSVFFRICNTVGGNFVPDVRLYVGSAVKNVLLEPWYCWHLGRFLPEIGPRCAGNAVSLRERGGPRSENASKTSEVPPKQSRSWRCTGNPKRVRYGQWHRCGVIRHDVTRMRSTFQEQEYVLRRIPQDARRG